MNHSDEYSYQDEWRNDGREIGEENEQWEDASADYCPKCGSFLMEYQGDQQMGASGHWFGIWECRGCGYRETT